MLTFRSAKAALASWSIARIGAVAMVSAITCISASADQMLILGCTGGAGSINCVARWGEAGDPYVRHIPPPDTQAEKNRAEERDHKWIDRCRPVVSQDNYGVPRYHYSAVGCEFGVIQ